MRTKFSLEVGGLDLIMHHENESTIEGPDPGEGDHNNGSDDVREPPVNAPPGDELPSPEDDVDPEDGGGRIEKRT